MVTRGTEQIGPVQRVPNQSPHPLRCFRVHADARRTEEQLLLRPQALRLRIRHRIVTELSSLHGLHLVPSTQVTVPKVMATAREQSGSGQAQIWADHVE